MSPFLPLLMSDLRVLGFLFLSFFPLLCPSMGGEMVFCVKLGFQSTWPVHILKWQFPLECKVEHLFNIFSIYSIKLYMCEGVGGFYCGLLQPQVFNVITFKFKRSRWKYFNYAGNNSAEYQNS